MRKVATLAEVPVDELLGWPLDDADRLRLATLGRRLDDLRLVSDSNGWTYDDGHGRNATGRPQFGTALSRYDDQSDWLELALYIWTDADPGPLVTATVEVACFCPTNHNVHIVTDQNFVVTTAAELVSAMSRAVDVLAAWAADADDPSQWRQRVDLPDR